MPRFAKNITRIMDIECLIFENKLSTIGLYRS